MEFDGKCRAGQFDIDYAQPRIPPPGGVVSAGSAVPGALQVLPLLRLRGLCRFQVSSALQASGLGDRIYPYDPQHLGSIGLCIYRERGSIGLGDTDYPNPYRYGAPCSFGAAQRLGSGGCEDTRD